MTEDLERYSWRPWPEAQSVVDRLFLEVVDRSPMAQWFQRQMYDQTGTRLYDWVDHIVAPPDELSELSNYGFELDAFGAYHHSGAIFPRFLPSEGDPHLWALVIKVDACEEFTRAHGLTEPIQGQPDSTLRKVCAERGDAAEFWAIERHGDRSFVPVPVPERCLEQSRMIGQQFSMRDRSHRHVNDLPEPEQEAWRTLRDMVTHACENLNQAWVADLFFKAERDYWMQRNRAAQVQKRRQDQLGLGWGNHDHHTYRSRRESFACLVDLFELMGLYCRERFHAGADAGWGAQVMESDDAGITVFADVDLSTTEVLQDFSHQGLAYRKELGTVGLWCELHGDSILGAGMHHLECQFDFVNLGRSLQSEYGIGVMPPFTDKPYLQQQFTQGERWKVDPDRIDRLLQDERITPEQAQQFHQQGAIGSHLENLERNEGYKGFNQDGISEIIAATDPRRLS